MPLSVEQILESLSQRVRYYELAHTAGDAVLEDLNRLEVCALVESLLGTHLRESSGWDEGAWVDSLVSVKLEMVDTQVALLSGAAVWRGRGGWFLDPLLARFELSQDLSSIRTYALQFGDADSGPGPARQQSEPPRVRRHPGRWRFVFRESR